MEKKVQEAYDKHWLVIKKLFPNSQIITNEKGIEEINPEYSNWLMKMRNELTDYTIDLLNSIGYKIQE